MRSRLLVSAAALAAGLAVASAQNAPGGGPEHTHRQARSQNRSPAVAPRKAEQTLRTRATGFDFQRPEQDRPRPGRRQLASPSTKERGQQDFARNRTPYRQTDQGMGRAGDRDPHSDRDRHGARNQTRRVAFNPERHRGGAPNANAGQEQVRKVQTALNQQGFNAGDPDGKLGKRTKDALITFQKQRGFRITGKADPTTLHALLATGGVTGVSQKSNQGSSNQPNSAPAPIQLVPQDVPPATTGRGDAAPEPAPPHPADGETSPARDGLQMPDTGASGRVPAGSPQEGDKDETTPQAGGDQR
jgi:hypothetical protein